MRLVTVYLDYARSYRELAAKLTRPEDKQALELMADGWAKAAAERQKKAGTPNQQSGRLNNRRRGSRLGSNPQIVNAFYLRSC